MWMRAWLSVVRPRSNLLTTLIISLFWYVKVGTLGIPCKVDLDWSYNHFDYFYIIDKLHFLSLISFWYPYYLFIPTNPLACNWGLLPPFSLLACYSKNLFCLFYWPPLFLLCLLWLHYIYHFFLLLSPFYLYIRTFPFIIFYSPTSEALHFLFYCLLSFHLLSLLLHIASPYLLSS